MPTQNLLAEVRVVIDDVEKAQHKLDRIRKSPIGYIPIVRGKLNSRRIDLEHKHRKLEIARNYLLATQ